MQSVKPGPCCPRSCLILGPEAEAGSRIQRSGLGIIFLSKVGPDLTLISSQVIRT